MYFSPLLMNTRGKLRQQHFNAKESYQNNIKISFSCDFFYRNSKILVSKQKKKKLYKTLLQLTILSYIALQSLYFFRRYILLRVFICSGVYREFPSKGGMFNVVTIYTQNLTSPPPFVRHYVCFQSCMKESMQAWSQKYAKRLGSAFLHPANLHLRERERDVKFFFFRNMANA